MQLFTSLFMVFVSCTCATEECGMSTWSPWSSCSRSCGGGMHSRSRQCNSGTGGVDCKCDGHRNETQTCNEHTCTDQQRQCAEDMVFSTECDTLTGTNFYCKTCQELENGPCSQQSKSFIYAKNKLNSNSISSN